MKWYGKAADQGLAEAQERLGFMYATGRGVRQDYAEAVKWFRKAARQGHAKAQQRLGTMYSVGRGIRQDYVQAHMWFNLAASRLARGSVREKTIRVREALAAKMTPAQIAEAQRLAREWRPE